MKSRKLVAFTTSIAALASAFSMTGCSMQSKSGKTVITMIQYKPESVKAFEAMEERFNATHDDIELKIESPNEAMTILKTRLIKEDYPDIIGIGGDINYSNFLDAELFMDISDFEGVDDIKSAYMQIEEDLEFIPQDGVYALPYVANAAGILYNKEMFSENGWEIPTTWTEFTELCDTISETTNIDPLYFGFKYTCTVERPCSRTCRLGHLLTGKCRKNNIFRGLQGSRRKDEVIAPVRRA